MMPQNNIICLYALFYFGNLSTACHLKNNDNKVIFPALPPACTCERDVSSGVI